MYVLYVLTHVQAHPLPFGDDQEACQREHDALAARLKEEYFGKNRREDACHTVKCPTGDATFALDKVEGVRIYDSLVDHDIYTKPKTEKEDPFMIEREVNVRRRLKEEGLLLSSDNNRII